MTQYLLAVHMVEGEPDPAQDVIQETYKDVETFDQASKPALKPIDRS